MTKWGKHTRSSDIYFKKTRGVSFWTQSNLLLDHQPGMNAHRLQLLKEQFARVRNLHLWNLGRVLAPFALIGLHPQVWHHDHATQITNINCVWIRNVIQSFLEELSCTMWNLTITLHFTKSKTTIAGSALCRLVIQVLNGSTSATVNFVIDHVLQPLVIRWTDENWRVHLPPREAIVEDFIAPGVVAVVSKEAGNFLHIDCVIERCGITDFTLVGRDFACAKGLNGKFVKRKWQCF